MVLVALVIFLVGWSTSSVEGVHRKEMLDPSGRYVLEWAVNWSDRTIIFNITAETLGWVGFGLSNSGKMSGADVVIGGMYSNGIAYLSDRHAVNHDVPLEDKTENWKMLDCTESGSHTFISLKRDLDTCDDEDYPVTENKVSVIWAMGKNDREVGYHGTRRGSYEVYLLDPSHSPRILRDLDTKEPLIVDKNGPNTEEDLKVWTIRGRRKTKGRETWCEIHEKDENYERRQVIGWDVYLGGTEKKGLRKLTVYKCNLPRAGELSKMTEDSLFGVWVGGNGEECDDLLSHTGKMPVQYCTEFYTVWGSGGRGYFNPEHVGFPLEGKREYYMVQAEYERAVNVDWRLDLFHTAKIRPNEGGVIQISHEIPGNPESFLIPPQSEQRIYGHCSPECTRRMLGPGGKIKVYGVLLHSQSSSARVRVHHFRRGEELPWIVYDENYRGSYQQIRVLREEREISAGDQITIDCSYNNRANNGSIMGGQDTCLAYLLYYNRIRDYHVCSSQLISAQTRKAVLGVDQITWNKDRLEWIVKTPSSLEGTAATQVVNSINWTPQLKDLLQMDHTLRPHTSKCYREPYIRHIPILPFEEGLSEDDFRGPISYPLLNAKEAYHGPERKCSK